MIKKVGFCDNYGQCEMADTKTPIELQGENLICPQCGRDLEGEKSIPRKLIIFVAIALLIMLPIAFLAFNWLFPPEKTAEIITNNNPTPSPTKPTKTPNALNECLGMPVHKNIWEDINRHGYIIMGVQSDADPMNYTGDKDGKGYKYSDREWKKAEKEGETGDQNRRLKELNWKRTGFDYDLMKLLAREMGITNQKGEAVRAREVREFKDLFCLLNRQEKDGDFSVDVIMSGIAKDDIYNDTIIWSKPYLDLYYSLVTK